MIMKPKHIIIIVCAVLLLCGFVLLFRTGVPSVVRLGSSMEVDNTDERRILLNNIDTLARDGLYYAAWGIGEKADCEDSNGTTVSLYDAQIYFLLGEYNDKDAAMENMQSWLNAGKTNYEVISEDEINFCGQTCTRLIYRFFGQDSLYSNGVSIFGVLNNSAVCIELTCRKTFLDDPVTTMDEFLDCCSYAAD
ncbi:MAG: hypothetical protein K2N63_11915 [Lachnospiraceae bacterium]|nr:hypothetical protein [Lachnospiraceae bacterium]